MSTVISVPSLRTRLVVGSGGCGWPGFLVLSQKKDEIHLHSFLPLQSALVPTSDCDISLSLSDPALLSVVGVVDGQVFWFYHERKKKFSYRASYLFRVHWDRLQSGTDQNFSPLECTGTGFSPFKHQSTSQLERTQPLMSSSSDQSEKELCQVYCDSLTDPALSVVGFCGLAEFSD